MQTEGLTSPFLLVLPWASSRLTHSRWLMSNTDKGKMGGQSQALGQSRPSVIWQLVSLQRYPWYWAHVGLSTLTSLATTAPWLLKPSSGFLVIWMTYALTSSPSKYIGDVGSCSAWFCVWKACFWKLFEILWTSALIVLWKYTQITWCWKIEKPQISGRLIQFWFVFTGHPVHILWKTFAARTWRDLLYIWNAQMLLHCPQCLLPSEKSFECIPNLFQSLSRAEVSL
jgi:hypothetical protein